MDKILTYVIENKTLQKITLSKPSDSSILRATARLMEIKGHLHLSLELFLSDNKTKHINIPAKEAVSYICELIPTQYKQMNITTASGNCEVRVSKKGKISVIDHIKKGIVDQVDLNHNRKKQYIIPDHEPVDFLIALGVQDSKGHIFDKKRAKFRQINRFLEIISDVEDNILKTTILRCLRDTAKDVDFSRRIMLSLKVMKCICNHPGISTKELALAVEISERSVKRYIDTLRMAGAMIEYVNKGWKCELALWDL